MAAGDRVWLQVVGPKDPRIYYVATIMAKADEHPVQPSDPAHFRWRTDIRFDYRIRPAAAQVGAARGRPARIVPPVPRLRGLERASAARRRGGPGRASRTAPRAPATRERVRPFSQAGSAVSMLPRGSIAHSGTIRALDRATGSLRHVVDRATGLLPAARNADSHRPVHLGGFRPTGPPVATRTRRAETGTRPAASAVNSPALLAASVPSSSAHRTGLFRCRRARSFGRSLAARNRRYARIATISS